MLLGIKADNILVEMEDSNFYINNVIIGIYDGNLSKSEKYKALIGLDILDNSQEIESYTV